jgi:hypothetical protein
MRRCTVPVVLALALPLLAPACDESGTAEPVAAPEAGGGAAGLVDPSVLERGEYLVRNVAGCGECHTPRDAQGNLDMSHWMAGVPDRFDLVPEDDSTGGISTPNLTPYTLGGWSDDEIKHAFLDGVGVDGAPLFPLMPYYVFHNMSAADADAVVTYLRALPAIAHDMPKRQPLPVALDAPAAAVPASAIPHTTLKTDDPDYASAERGRYLAGEVGVCLDCHTPWRLGAGSPLDMSRPFAGGRTFSAKEWGVQPPAPAVVYSYDLTPHLTGIAGWTPADVANVLAHGTAPSGVALCRPMPFGPFGSFGGMHAPDAHDIGVYLTTLAPIDGGNIPQCPQVADAAP